jgi:hypothetical protein
MWRSAAADASCGNIDDPDRTNPLGNPGKAA